MDNTPSDPLIGRAISQYEVVAKIGGGGMGVVYKAMDQKLGRAVALKFLPPQWSHDEGAKQRFLREAQAASATNHRNICIIHDIARTDDGQLFIVMAYYEGQTLKQTLEAGPLPVADALEIAAEVAEGLAKAHAQGVVHRDVKPGNLMITDDGVKVLDFGLAKFADSLQLTMAGSTIGTVAYMSPEQARGEEADARSDVWALGVVLYEMLTGRVPFRGAYQEAVFHAIKNEPVPPLGASGRELPAAVEMLVLRALEKDPERRYQSTREVARDIRLLQGRTVPLDLRTEQLPFMGPANPLRQGFGGQEAGPHAGSATLSRRQRLRRAVTPARAIAAIVAVALVAAGTYAWMTRPVVRIAVAIAPVANHTGEPELDSYRMALTEALVDEVNDSPNIRVVPYSRLLGMVRRFIGSGDVSSSEAIQAIATQSGASFIIIPSIEYRGGMWLAQAQVRSVQTGTVTNTYETDAFASSLPKDTALRHIPLLAERIQAHFKANGPGRSYAGRPASARFRTLDAVKAYEEGLRAYDELEYASSLAAFRRAATADDRNAMAQAWMGRVLLLLYQHNEAAAASQRARQLLNADTPEIDGTFVDAVLAETLGDFDTAERHYRRLATGRPDEAAGRAELADFLRRRDRNQQAVETYHEVLRLDAGDIWAHAQLCLLYTRLNDYPLAEAEGNAALMRYRAAGHRGGEAQALLCVGEAQRNQAGPRLKEARQNAAGARAIFEMLDQPYNLSRACLYQGLVEYADLNDLDARRFFEEALSRSRSVGNRLTEGVALMNLAATYYDLQHQPAPAIDFYGQSHDVFDQIGEERRAAEQDVNAAGVQVDYRNDDTDAIRRLPSARAVLDELGYVDFAVMAMQVEARARRYQGRLDEARRQFDVAKTRATEKQLSDRVDSLTIDLAKTDLLRGEYERARAALADLVARDADRKHLEARIVLGRVLGRMGDFDGGRQLLNEAIAGIEARRLSELLPDAHMALGEFDDEQGRPADARLHFQRADERWTDDFPDAASVDARSYLGLLDGLARRDPAAARKIQSSVDQARKMGRLDLEARARARLARLALSEKRFADAAMALEDIPLDGARTVGPELGARMHEMRAGALDGQGDPAGAGSERALARKLARELQARLPAPFRERFAARPDMQRLLTEGGQ